MTALQWEKAPNKTVLKKNKTNLIRFLQRIYALLILWIVN